MRINDPGWMEKLIADYMVSEMFGRDMRPHLSLYRFKRNEFICREGEEIEHLYVFLYGKAKVTSDLSNGKSLLLDFYYRTMLLGELELMTDQNAASSVQAIEDCYCLGIPVDLAKEMLLNDAVFLLYAGRSLSWKLERTAKNSSINLLYPLEIRLASYILAVGVRATGEEGEGILFKTNLTQTADLLGTSYRHLLRTLEKLRESGLLRKEGRTYRCEDAQALRRLAGDIYHR